MISSSELDREMSKPAAQVTLNAGGTYSITGVGAHVGAGDGATHSITGDVSSQEQQVSEPPMPSLEHAQHS